VTPAPRAGVERLVALGMVALGAVLVLSSGSKPRVTVAGATLEHGQADVPGATALALVALAGLGATLLLRGWTRAVVGVLIAAAGLLLGLLNLAARNDVSTVVLAPGPSRTALTAWFWLTAAGAVLLVAGGALIAVHSRRWPAPRRDYEAAAGARPARQDAWTAIDRGEDPTL
jgi:hypothetical protein